MARLGKRAALIPFIVAVFLYWVSLYLYTPTLPTYVRSKADNLAMVGAVLSMYGLWQAVVRLPLGVASDWVGRRKPFILAGFALAALGPWVLGSARGVDGLLIGRSITGLGAGTWVPMVVLFSSLFPPKEAVRASALLTMVGSAARVLATALTGTLNRVGGYPLAFFLAAGAAVLAFLVLLPTREVRRPPQTPSIKGILAVSGRRDVLLPSLLSMVGQYANWGATFGFVPIMARQLGATDISNSLLMSMNLTVVTAGNLLATAIVRRIGTRRLVYTSYGFMAAGLLGLALSPSLPWIFACQFSLGVAQGLNYPVLMGLSIRDVGEAERTTAMGFHQAVYAIGMFAGPALSGVLAEAMGMRPMFGVTAFACLALGLLGTRLLGRERRAEQGAA
jgi:MFS family permease